jgi:hypothetical protein
MAFVDAKETQGRRAAAGLEGPLFPFGQHDIRTLRVRSRFVDSRALPIDRTSEGSEAGHRCHRASEQSSLRPSMDGRPHGYPLEARFAAPS